MVYFNRTNADYFGRASIDFDFDDRRIAESAPQDQRGLYYRQHVFPGLRTLVDACVDGEAPFDELTFDALQAWNELGWKQPHATLEAAERFASKALEERGEVSEAFEEYWDTRNPEHVVEELGDLGWTITALASNAGIVVSDTIKQRAYEYSMGTKEFDDTGSVVDPSWYDAMASLAIRRGSVKLGDVDAVLREGFFPWPSASMNRDGGERISPTVYLHDLRLYIMLLRSINEDLYGAERSVAVRIPPDRIDACRSIVAESWLDIAAMAHYVGSTLSEVVSTNIQKVTHRVSHNLVDKTDGSRD